MTVEERAGGLLWCGWGGDHDPASRTVTDHARWLLEEVRAGGLVLFPRNTAGPAETAALLAELRDRAPGELLLGIDQEGGRVSRLTWPGMVFPGNMAAGRHGTPDATREIAGILARQLRALGFDTGFAPVLDVNNNPANPVIGVRSFSSDPHVAAAHGAAAVRGAAAEGLLPVGKHFPGHGDTSVDSHHDLPVQPASLERLGALELVSFRAAIDAGLPAMMTTHILFPALDPEWPATLSHPILTGLLRERMGFDGLVVTDCLEMAGVAGRWSPEERAVRAVLAGADMLLVCHTRETQGRMHRALCDAIRDGAIPEARLADAERRRAGAVDFVRRTPRPPLSEVGNARVAARERERCRAWIEKLPGPARPARFRRDRPWVAVGDPAAAGRVAVVLRELGLDARTGGPDEDLGAGQVVWVAGPGAPGGPPALATNPTAVAVSVGMPDLLERVPGSIPRWGIWGSHRAHLQALVDELLEGPEPNAGSPASVT